MLHLKTNGPWNSTTPKLSPRQSNLEGDVPSTEVRASKFFISKFYHHVAVADCNQGIVRLHCTIKKLHQSTPGQIGAKAELILGWSRVRCLLASKRMPVQGEISRLQTRSGDGGRPAPPGKKTASGGLASTEVGLGPAFEIFRIKFVGNHDFIFETRKPSLVIRKDLHIAHNDSTTSYKLIRHLIFRFLRNAFNIEQLWRQ
jgi:hypothetical protein